MGDDEEPVQGLERAWRAWAERPTRLSPDQASRRVAEALVRRRRRVAVRRTLAAVAALVVVALALGIRRDQVQPIAVPRPAAGAQLGAGQVLIWLDAETPLYMTFEAPAAPEGGLP